MQKNTNANLTVHDIITFNITSTQCHILSGATKGAIAGVSIFMLTEFMLCFHLQVMVKQQFKENKYERLKSATLKTFGRHQGEKKPIAPLQGQVTKTKTL